LISEFVGVTVGPLSIGAVTLKLLDQLPHFIPS
jgi:hypothetical protein